MKTKTTKTRKPSKIKVLLHEYYKSFAKVC